MLKNILDKGLGKKWQLTQEESASVWDSVSKSLGSAPKTEKKGGFLYWAGAAVAAAVVAGFFLFRSPSSVQTPFQPKITPTEKTTTLAEGSGVSHTSHTDGTAQEKEAQNPMLAHAAKLSANGRHGSSETIEKPFVQPDSKYVSEEQPVAAEEEAAAASIQAEEKSATSSGKSTGISKEKSYYGKSGREWLGEYSSKKTPAKRFSMSASSTFSGRSKMNATANPMVRALAEHTSHMMYSHAPVIEHITGTTYSLPLNVAVGLTYKINDKLSVGTGLSYSYLHSKYDGRVDMVNYSITQDVHYVGIPLNLYVNLASRGNLDFYAVAGGSIEKGIKADYSMTTFEGKRTNTDSHVKGVQFSVRAAGGMEYRLGKGKNVGIYLEPAMVYYLDSKLPASIRTDQPLQIEAQAGVRFHLK